MGRRRGRVMADGAIPLSQPQEEIIQEKLDLVSRAGGSYYSRAKNGFFGLNLFIYYSSCSF